MLLALSPFPSYAMTTPRSSSPLNPNPNVRSSSPLSSPTPGSSSSRYQSFSLPSPSSYKSYSNGTAQLRSTRYMRPSKRASLPSSSTTPTGSDLFSEGTTPMEGLMWREKFSRRVEAREKRKADRNNELDKRRGLSGSIQREMSVEEEEEQDRKAQEDDEEIFRRLVILQRKKFQHASLVSHEMETGGSDPLTPEFWEDELEELQKEERELMNRLDNHTDEQNNQIQIQLQPHVQDQDPTRNQEEAELEEWQIQAALAEQEELELEEMNFADQVEHAYFAHQSQSHRLSADNVHTARMDVDMDMDLDSQVNWDAFDSMDIE
ncbi:hypothetical protein I204_02673 [Kwoniella mangroviensis CBS 8886]|nr:hypothetical protein I204_02673 [Kwoniella mangroviensis CBS 8886]